MNQSVRFELEQALMQTWQTADDIEILYHYFGNQTCADQDELMNALLGLYTLHNIKSRRAFDIFEKLLKEIGKDESRISQDATKTVETTQGSH